MPGTRDEILQAALDLPESDRMTIVSRLLETLPDDLLEGPLDDAELAAELERRSGDATGAIPWEQLRDETRQVR